MISFSLTNSQLMIYRYSKWLIIIHGTYLFEVEVFNKLN